jgi:hypothetical protein
MFKKTLIVFYVLFSLIILSYVSLPNYNFPTPPPDSVQSKEPADMEEPLRKAYFTNYTRNEVLSWYKAQFDYSSVGKIKLPTYLLNYPPEESQSIIRDQTRSTFLQEVVHPFRETVFINGYEPATGDDKNRIVIDGTHWRQKIIIKYIPSTFILRFIITLASLAAIPVLYSAFVSEFSFLKKMTKSRRIK